MIVPHAAHLLQAGTAIHLLVLHEQVRDGFMEQFVRRCPQLLCHGPQHGFFCCRQADRGYHATTSFPLAQLSVRVVYRDISSAAITPVIVRRDTMCHPTLGFSGDAGGRVDRGEQWHETTM